MMMILRIFGRTTMQRSIIGVFRKYPIHFTAFNHLPVLSERTAKKDAMNGTTVMSANIYGM